MDCMEKEFEDYWNKHQKRLILNAPKALRDEYFESTKLDSPIDWVCFYPACDFGHWPPANFGYSE